MTNGGKNAEAARPPHSARRLRVCFVAPNGFGALSGNATEHSGGVERQTALWARWFARRGHEVQLVTWDVGQEEGVRIDGVTVRTFCRSSDGLPGLRYFHPRWTSLIAALARADADVYHYMNGDSKLGQMALWCRRRHRALTYYVSSNRSTDPVLPNLVFRERFLYRLGLRQADRVVAQTNWQRQQLLAHFGVESTVIGMPYEEVTPNLTLPSKVAAFASPMILWVGRISSEKRLEWLLDLATACPDLRFEVAGAPNGASAYADALWSRGLTLKNVTLHGRVANPLDMAALYRRATLLCCTSSSEGFPNTFLEAWSHGVPVVTSFDPDGIVASQRLGAVATDVPGLATAVRHLLGSSAGYMDRSQDVWRYYQSNHRPDAVLERVEKMYFELSR